MGRNITVEGITLRSRRFQEFHKDVTILCRKGGIIQAVLHGGYKGKSRLAGGTEPFRQVNFMIYHNPVKDAYKITDGEVLNSFEFLRSDLAKIYLASLWSEIMIKTRGMGAGEEEGEGVFLMLLDALMLLDVIENQNLPLLNIQFLWRLLAAAGLNMDLESCASCGRSLAEGNKAFFNLRERGFFCGKCGGGADPGFSSLRDRCTPFSAGSFGYLRDTLAVSMGEALEIVHNEGNNLLLERIPLLVMVSEMDFKLKTADYHQFLVSL